MTSKVQNHHNIWLLVLIIVVSVLLRTGMALYSGDAIGETRGGTYDQISYDALAQRVVQGHGFSFAENHWPYARAGQPTAFWSFLYTLCLAGIYFLVGHHPLVARLIQAVIVGIAMPWLVFRIGRRAFGERVGLIAAFIVAIYSYFVNYAASLMTESLYIVGILWTVDVAMRLAAQLERQRQNGQGMATGVAILVGFELGIALAITLLLRQVAVVFFVAMGLWLLWSARKRDRVGQAVTTLAIAGLVTILALSPFVMRNYRAFGRLTLPNSNAGFTFFWSNHPIYGTRFEPVLSPSHGVSYQDLIPVELRNLNEAELDRALLLRGLQFVRDDPGRYLLLSLSRIPVYFLFWPTPDSTALSNAARVLSFGLFLPFMVYGLLLCLRRLRLPDGSQVSDGSESGLQREYVILFLLFIVVYTTVHLASWANVRYRLPVDAFLILFAACAINDLIARWSERGDQAALSSRACPESHLTH